MAHFAKVVDEIVEKVIVAEQDFIDTQEGTWVQTSYNTKGGVHYTYEEHAQTIDGEEIVDIRPVPSGEAGLRKNYAGVGFTYDEERDAFIPPQPYPSWTLNEDTCLWDSPVPYPEEGVHEWDEDNQEWVELSWTE